MENWNILRELLQPEILQFVLVAVCTVIWFAIKRVVKKFDRITDKLEGVEQRLDEKVDSLSERLGGIEERLDSKVDSLRSEIIEQRHEYNALMQELVRRETCAAFRTEIMRRIDRWESLRGVAFTPNGAALVNINDAKQMHELMKMMTPEERRTHLASCQFRSEETEETK